MFQSYPRSRRTSYCDVTERATTKLGEHSSMRMQYGFAMLYRRLR